jgi:hypothetical protein
MKRRSRKGPPGDPVFLAEMAALLESRLVDERARLALTDEERAHLARVVTRPFTPYASLGPVQ